MAAKVQFDHTERLIRPTVSPDTNRIITIDVITDIYSDGKEDWLADTVLNKFRFPVRAIGGQVVSAGKLGTTFLLTDGWRIDPNLSGDSVIGSVQQSTVVLFGGTGTNELVRQGFQLAYPGYVREGYITMRSVGTPQDNLRIQIQDAIGTVYESVDISGSAIGGSFMEVFFPSELETEAEADEQLYFVFNRTGSRDTDNYFEFAVDDDVYALGEAAHRDNDVWQSLGGDDLVLRYRSAVPYQLQLNGNIFTDSGLPVSLSVGDVNVQQTVSTLVELEQALILEDIRKLFFNAFKTDPVTGEMVVYDDDGVTPAFTAGIWEDVAKTQPYRGQGIERRDALEPDDESV
jgi:hypothetical protein